MNHYDIKVTGKVQGVFFRDTARREAEKLGISGRASNQADGAVLIEAEGIQAALDKLVDWCRRGPKGAQVETVQVSQGEVRGYRGFEVKW